MKKIFNIKNALVFTTLVLWVFLGINYYVKNNYNNEDMMLEAFSKTSFADEESTISVNAKYNGDYLSRESAKTLLAEIAMKLGVDNNYDITENREANKGEIILSKVAKRAQTTIKFITYENRVSEHEISAEQYIFIELKLYGASDCAMDYREVIEGVLDEYEVAKQVTVGFKGTYDGKLTLVEKDIISDKLLNTLNADIVTERRSDDSYVIYANSKYISDYKIVGYDKINIGLAMTYDEENEKTNLYLSTPLIDQDY